MFIIELVPPKDPANLQKYYEKISTVVNETKRASIASKPSEQSASGFERSINLVNFLLDLEPNLDILFHVTCRDLNRTNINSRLQQLRNLNINKILVVTGDKYTPPSDDISYENSSKLLQDILEHYNWFKSIAVAGYPGGNGHQTHDNDQECRRLSAVFKMGANAVYTQCIFDVQSFKEFNDKIKETHAEIEVVPSVALFKSSLDLDRIISLTRVNNSSHLDDLRSHLSKLNHQQGETYCSEFLFSLCTNLAPTIDLCAFGHFELAESLIKKLTTHETT